MASRVYFEPIKTLAFGGISGAYAAVGSPTEFPVRAFCISNNTQGDLYFTTDDTQDEMFLAAGSFRLYDLQSNINPQFDDRFVLATGTQFSVKQITAPVSGSVYIECIYG
jgi:hypothetical protein